MAVRTDFTPVAANDQGIEDVPALAKAIRSGPETDVSPSRTRYAMMGLLLPGGLTGCASYRK